MIKQKYNYDFFYNKYSYRCDSMFKKYYKELENKYKYFIITFKDINKYKSNQFRSNLNLNEIFVELRNMNIQKATIINSNSIFPNFHSIEFINIDNKEQITKIYKNGLSETRKNIDGQIIYTIWWDKTGSMTVRVDLNNIRISYKGYTISSKVNSKEVKVHKSTPLSAGRYIEYSSLHKEMIEKVVSRFQKENINGFYDYEINIIKNEFNIF